jgi:OOP family OmpA-OmpF porin
MKSILTFLVMLAACACGLAQDDKSGCADHPLFNRMTSFYIYECRSSEFEEAGFYTETEGTNTIGGRFTYLGYQLMSGATPTSSTQIVANHINAIVKLGGKVLYKSSQQATLMLVKGSAETWVTVAASADSYRLTIVQREAMKQVVEANADFMKQGLNENGKIALYGILFDFGKSTLRPESAPVLNEISLLLKADASLIVFVVGHTDNVGDYAMNLKLSNDRAASVVRELTTKYAVRASQLIPFGAGPTSPVASNDTDQGRQLNRRVELVKK